MQSPPTPSRLRSLIATLGAVTLGVTAVIPAVGLGWLFAVPLAMTLLQADAPDAGSAAAGILLVLGLALAETVALFTRGPLAAPNGRRLRSWLSRHPWWSGGALLLLARLIFGLGDVGLVASVSFVTLSFMWLVAVFGIWVTGWGLKWAKGSWAATAGTGAMAAVAAVAWFTALQWVSTGVTDVAEEFQRANVQAQSASAALSSDSAAVPLPAEPGAGPSEAESDFLAVASVTTDSETVSAFGRPFPQTDEFRLCVETALAELKREAVSVAQRFVRPSDAEEVVHDAILLVCRSPPTEADFRRHLFRAVAFAGMDHFRKSRRNAPEPPLEIICELTPEDEVADQEVSRMRFARLGEAFRSLSPDDQQMLNRRLEGETFAEIAASLGIKPNAAEQRFSRAGRRLRANYDAICAHATQ